MIGAMGNADRNGNPPGVISKRPVLDLFAYEERVGDKDVRTVGSFDLGRAHADLAHDALFAADHD